MSALCSFHESVILESLNICVMSVCCGAELCGLTQKEVSETPQGRALARGFFLRFCCSRLSNFSVVAGKNAGQSTKLLMYILSCVIQPRGKNYGSEENSLHFPTGTGNVIDRNLVEQG